MYGELRIDPKEARLYANEMLNSAKKIRNTLDAVVAEIDQIDNEDTNIYFGDNKPAELKNEMVRYSQNFGSFYEQIANYVVIINKEADRAEQQ